MSTDFWPRIFEAGLWRRRVGVGLAGRKSAAAGTATCQSPGRPFSYFSCRCFRASESSGCPTVGSQPPAGAPGGTNNKSASRPAFLARGGLGGARKAKGGAYKKSMLGHTTPPKIKSRGPTCRTEGGFLCAVGNRIANPVTGFFSLARGLRGHKNRPKGVI